MTEQNQKVEKYRNYFLGASVVVLVLLLGFLFLINMGSFGSLTDKGSLTLTDLKKLDYPATHPGFLACDPADCPAALPNRGAYAFAVPAQKLRQIIVALSDIDPTIELKN